MIELDKTLISEIIFERKFTCNLEACKGACCVEGDAGAPLEKEEADYLDEHFDEIEPYLRPEGIEAIKKEGRHVFDFEGDLVTTLVEGKECAYTIFESDGTAKCGIERANADGAIDFIKPISCHLYPIRITKISNHEALNYSKWEICNPACELGNKLGVKVYRFLKDPLIRKFGESYFEDLERIDRSLEELIK